MIRIVANFRQGCRANGQKHGDCKKTQNDVAISDSFGKQGRLDVKVQIHRCMDGEECDENATENAVIRVEFFVR